LDQNHLKSHFRLAKCLNELKWHREAKECIDIFVRRFPDYASSQACENLIKDINNELKKLKESDKKKNGSSKNTKRSRLGEAFVDNIPKEEDEDENAEVNRDGDDEDDSLSSQDSEMPPLEGGSDDDEEEAVAENAAEGTKKKKTDDTTTDTSSDSKSATTSSSQSIDSSLTKRLIKEYTELKEHPNDFKSRFSGHCNVATDIKECNYLGE
jgi:hypothetical protein